jgi:hypothetical protein
MATISFQDTPLLRFYKGAGADASGRRLDDLLAWDDLRLEAVHDYIQWLFPLPDVSRFNPDAPILTAAEAEVFRSDAKLRSAVSRAFDRFLTFLGFARDGARIARGSHFARRAETWLTPANHNYLRITRILLCLGYLGLAEQAMAFLAALEDVAAGEGGTVIGSRTLTFWRDAVRKPPPLR